MELAKEIGTLDLYRLYYGEETNCYFFIYSKDEEWVKYYLLNMKENEWWFMRDIPQHLINFTREIPDKKLFLAYIFEFKWE